MELVKKFWEKFRKKFFYHKIISNFLKKILRRQIKQLDKSEWLRNDYLDLIQLHNPEKQIGDLGF